MTLSTIQKALKKEFLISELHRFVDEFGFVPTASNMDSAEGYPSVFVYKKYFETWNNALIKAGFEINKINEYRTGNETCCKCGCTEEQTKNWHTKGLLKGEVMCNTCYQRIYQNPDYKNGNLDKESSIGKATISQRVVAKVLGLELKDDCNCSEGFDYPYDLYDEGRYNYINVKDSKLHNSLYQNSYWKFKLTQKETPDTYIMLGYDEDRKNILHVWITNAVDDLVYNERTGKLKKSIGISDTYDSLMKAEPWEVDSEPYNDMLHQMSKKRKETDGEECFLSNSDLKE